VGALQFANLTKRVLSNNVIHW